VSLQSVLDVTGDILEGKIEVFCGSRCVVLNISHRLGSSKIIVCRSTFASSESVGSFEKFLVFLESLFCLSNSLVGTTELRGIRFNGPFLRFTCVLDLLTELLDSLLRCLHVFTKTISGFLMSTGGLQMPPTPSLQSPVANQLLIRVRFQDSESIDAFILSCI